MLRRATFRIAAVLAPWLCAWSVGCQGLAGRERTESGASFAQAAQIPAAEAPSGLAKLSYEVPSNAGGATGLATPVQTASYSPAEAPGRAAILGNPRIGPNSDVAWSIKDLPAAPGSLVGGRAIVDGEGRVELGNFGSLVVAGLTPAEATVAIEDHVKRVTAQGGRAIDSPPRMSRPMAAAPLPSPPPVPPANPLATAQKSDAPVGKASAQEVAARPRTDPALRPVAHMAQANTPAPQPTPPPPEHSPAGDPLPPPRAVPGEHLAPVPVDPGVESPCGGDGMGVPRELAMASLPPYVLDPPDVLVVESTQGLRDQPIRGQHLIRPDGTISLGIYGSVHVAGMTIDHARLAIAQVLSQRIKDFDPKNLSVDVLSSNSKVYYVITDGGGYGEQVYRVPVTGSETVLDAISQINGLPPVASKRKIWVARRTAGDGGPVCVYPVDWRAITQQGISATNYQVLPGDRIYVKADCLMRIDAALAKVLSPVQRILGTTLLGAAAVNTIATGGTNGLGGNVAR